MGDVFLGWPGKTTMIWRTAVRETGVSRHNGSLIQDPPETSQTSQNCGTEGFKGDSQLGPHYAERREPTQIFR